MALPFLGITIQVTRERRRRSQKIRKEITAYYAELERIYPLLQIARSELQIQESGPTIPDVPLLLIELETVERWGLPNPGSWMDQPCEYMADLESVRMARDVYKPAKAASVATDIDTIFASAPTPKAVTG